jgi:imidazolonepropionase-like amidohydrolase
LASTKPPFAYGAGVRVKCAVGHPGFNAKSTLEAGFTTVRNVGSANFDDVALKQGTEQGYIPGPRIVPATYAIGATGGHCDYTEFPPSIRTPTDAIANGPEDLRAMVRKLRKYGAEVIKFCGTGGRLAPGDHDPMLTARSVGFPGYQLPGRLAAALRNYGIVPPLQ